MKATKSINSSVAVLRAVLFIVTAAILAFTLIGASMTNVFALSYGSDYGTRANLRAEALRTNETLMEEGITLLKNEDNALPLSDYRPRVTVFGKSSVNPVWSGSGSSGGTSQPTRTPYESLWEAGIETNEAMRQFYMDNDRSGTGRGAASMNSYQLAGIPIGETRAVGNVKYAGESDVDEKGYWNQTTCPVADMNYDPATTANSNYESVRDSYSSYNDAAVVIISRIGGEGFDVARTMRGAYVDSGTDYPKGTSMSRYTSNSGAWDDDAIIVPGARNMNDHYLQLDQNETNMLKEAAYYFDNVIVVLNCATQMELGFLDDPGHYAYQENIKAALWMATPGENGFMALGRVLTGKVNPSGGLVSTWYRDFKADPTWNNIGNFLGYEANRYTYKEGNETKTSGIRFIDYQEGIYMGSRYYETRGYDEGFGTEYTTNGTTVPHVNGTTTRTWDDWYQANVVYPLGHGLSYSDFTCEVTEARMDSRAFAPDSELTPNRKSTFEVDVKVTNNSDSKYSGKHTVELYATAPYTNGGIEKSHKVMVGFAKSKKLAPGASQILTISVDAYHMASFDYADKNQNGFKGYELEAGDYALTVGSDAHDDSLPIKFKVTAGLKIDKDPVTDEDIVLSFEEESAYMENDSVVLSREDGFKNLNTITDGKLRRLRDKAWLESYGVLWNQQANPSNATSEWNFYINPTIDGEKDGVPHNTKDNYEEIFELSGAPIITKAYDLKHPDKELTYAETTLKFWDMTGLDFDDPLWDDMMEQLTWEQMSALIGTGMYHNAPIDNIGKPLIVDFDGPVGWTKGFGYRRGSLTAGAATETPIKLVSTCIIAATYNVELARKMGGIVGEEGMYGHDATTHDPIAGWYAPGANLHRSPFSGRNFEYFSENEYLTGRIAAAMVTGAQDKGVYSYIKHFFLNDQETDRNTNGVSTWATEQSMREMYARGFEVAIKEANENNDKLLAVMTGYNRVGRVWVGGDYGACTQLLRNEWGYNGVSITDNTYDYRAWMNSEQSILAGSDKILTSQLPSYDPTTDKGTRAMFPTVDEKALNNTTYGNTYKWAIHNAAKHILYVTCNSNAVNVQNRVFAEFATLSVGSQNADGTAPAIVAGKPFRYNLFDDLAPEYRPHVNTGDRSKVTFKYSVHPLVSDTNSTPKTVMPEGVTLAEDGTLSGVAKKSGTYKIGVNIAASTTEKGVTYLDGYQMVTLTVAAAGDDFAATSLGGGFLGTAMFDETFSATIAADRSSKEGFGFEYSLADGYALPEGLTLDSSTGVISGTVTGDEPYTATVLINVAAKIDAITYETASAYYTIAVGENVGPVGPVGPEGPVGPQGPAGNDASGCNGSITGGGWTGIIVIGAAFLALAVLVTIKRVKSNKK